MKNRKRKFLQAGIVMMTLLLGSVVSYGECVHYINGEPILENYIYFDADHVPLHFEYDIMEENAKILAPGIKETKTIAFENDKMQHVDYTCEIDLSNGTNQVLLGYEPGRLTSVSEQIFSVETKTGKNVVAAVNGCFFEMEDARPNGLLISDGKTYESWNKAQKKVTTNGLKAPSGLKASNVAASGKVKLTWNKVKGADAYCVYRAASKNGKYTLMKTVTKTSYTNTSSKAGKLYYYRVTAISRSDKRLNSEVSKTVSRRCDLQRPVINVSNDRKSGKPKLTWKEVQGAETYKVYRSTKKNGKYTYLGKTRKTTYINKNAKKGKNYWYKVKAVDAKYSSAASAMSTPKRGKYPL